MNPVHAVLRNWDILQVIMNFVKDEFNWRSRPRDLAAVALVCRGLSDLAVKFLWRDIDLNDVNFLFPMDMIRVDFRGTKSLTRIPATPQEWERFDVHASQVHKLSASPKPDDLFLRGFRTRYPTLQHPFPNLTCLEWSCNPASITDAMILLCPTITEVRLSIVVAAIEDDDDDDDDDGDGDDAVAAVVRSIGETCSRLCKFEYRHSYISENQSKIIETSLIYLIRQCRLLEDVHLPVSRDLLRSLASLPHLWTLRLDYAKWKGVSQLHLPIEANECIEEADRFPVLDNLIIQGSHTVSSLTKCFRGSGCFPRESFAMWDMSECDQWSSLAIAKFFRGILRPDRREGLLVFWIDREFYGEDFLEDDPWQALRCLSSTPNLQTLILTGLLLDINDTDLEEIAQILPDLHSLSLDVPNDACYEEYQSQISFQGLAHLSTLKNLKNVSLMLAPDSTISESMLVPSTPSNSRLRGLTIHGKFPPVPPYAAALFLILHFPRLKRIKTSLELDDREEQRMELIQGLLKSARLMAKDLRSERGGSGTLI